MELIAQLRAWTHGRQRRQGAVRAPAEQRRVYSQGGGGTLPRDGFPVVLVNGEAVGLWRLTAWDGAPVELSDRVGARPRACIDERLGMVAALLVG